jgi:hypothetical protein
MGVALTALVLATTGTSFAAASYVSNAGKVDGRDAVSSKTTTVKAAGALVATAGAGPLKGQIPGKFLAEVQRGDADSFQRYAAVQDNAQEVPAAIASIPGIGTLTATCGDQNAKPAEEDPITRLTFGNTTPAAIDFAQTSGLAAPEIGAVLPGTTSTLTIGGSTTFQITLRLGDNVGVFSGVVRQDARNTNDAKCLVYGSSELFTNTH